MEEWRTISDNPNYEVSNMGQVRNRLTGLILKQSKPRNIYGYYGLDLGSKNKRTVHSLVAREFIGERPEGMVIDHINRNKYDNRPENLRYCTQSENIKNRNRTTLGYIYDKKDGRAKPYCSSITINKKRHTKYFATRDEAQEWLNSFSYVLTNNNLS